VSQFLTTYLGDNKSITLSQKLNMYQVFSNNNHECLATLHRSAVLLHLEHCSSVWDLYHKIHMKALEGVETVAARLVTKKTGRGVVNHLELSLLARAIFP